MREEPQNPQINMAKIPVDGNVAGAIFALGSVAICLTGIPVLGYLLLAAIVVGGGVSLMLRLLPHDAPGASWIRSGLKK
jgi:hypothetical protein